MPDDKPDRDREVWPDTLADWLLLVWVVGGVGWLVVTFLLGLLWKWQGWRYVPGL